MRVRETDNICEPSRRTDCFMAQTLCPRPSELLPARPGPGRDTGPGLCITSAASGGSISSEQADPGI